MMLKEVEDDIEKMSLLPTALIPTPFLSQLPLYWNDTKKISNISSISVSGCSGGSSSEKVMRLDNGGDVLNFAGLSSLENCYSSEIWNDTEKDLLATTTTGPSSPMLLLMVIGTIR